MFECKSSDLEEHRHFRRTRGRKQTASQSPFRVSPFLARAPKNFPLHCRYFSVPGIFPRDAIRDFLRATEAEVT